MIYFKNFILRVPDSDKSLFAAEDQTADYLDGV
jgi:hypothetical protein